MREESEKLFWRAIVVQWESDCATFAFATNHVCFRRNDREVGLESVSDPNEQTLNVCLA